MKKNGSKGCIILAILFVLLSVIAFAVPPAKMATFWISYAFTAAAFAAQIFIWKTALGRTGTLKSKFLGLPVVYIGVVYLAVQIIAFVVFLFFPTLPAWSAVIACTVIAGISSACVIAVNIGANEISRIDSKAGGKNSGTGS